MTLIVYTDARPCQTATWSKRDTPARRGRLVGMATKAKVTGGNRLGFYAGKAKAAAAKSKSAEIGIFAESKYPNGKPVALVGAIHEFGLGRQAETPFFRTAIESSKREINAVIKAGVDPKTMVLTESTVRQAGDVLAGAVRRNLKVEPTRLVDTAKLASSIDVRVTPTE